MPSRLQAWLVEQPTRAFFVLTFAFAWALWIPVGLAAPHYLRVTALPGAWSPTLAAVLLTSAAEGRPGLRALWRRVFRFRQAAGWYLAAVLGVPTLAAAAIAFNTLLGGRVPPLSLPAGVPLGAWPVAIPLLFVSNVLIGGPIAEETGWRGYALPLMGRSMTALQASLIIGTAWGVWHLPFFAFPGAAGVVGEIGFFWFVLLTIPWSVLFGWVYVNTESIFMAILCHAAVNTTLGSSGILAAESDGRLLPLLVAVTWIAAALVVLRYGSDLGREAAAARNRDSSSRA